MGIEELAVNPNPRRSLTRRLAERLHIIDEARRQGWAWREIRDALAAELADEGVVVPDATVVRKLVARARRLVESGKVQPRPLPRPGARGGVRPSSGLLSRPAPASKDRAPSASGGAFDVDDDDSLIQEF